MTEQLKHQALAALTLTLIFVSIDSERVFGAESLPNHVSEFIRKNCQGCHSGDDAQAGVRFESSHLNWQNARAIHLWERVYDVVSKHEMPPSESPQPTIGQRERMSQWLQSQLSRHARPGGTTIRRLNREEYENSIRDLFDFPEFNAPDAFPADDTRFGFDNIGEALILSPPLLAQYLELATQVADTILPPDNGDEVAVPKHYHIGATGLAESAWTTVEGDRFRLASSKRDNAHTAGWPIRFSAPKSGVYRLTVDAVALQTDEMFYPRQEAPFRLSIYAKKKTEQTYDAFANLRKLKAFDVPVDQSSPHSFTCDVELNRGESFGLRWGNGPIDSNGFNRVRLKQDRKLHAAMLGIKRDPRGMTQSKYYELTLGHMANGLNLDDPRLDEELEGRGFGGIGHKNGPPLMVNWFAHEEVRRYGPALDITEVSIEGPTRLIEDDEMRVQKKRTATFLGKRPENVSDRAYVKSVIGRFLQRAFRRSVSDQLVQKYTDLVLYEMQRRGARVQDGLHVAIRRALVSPNFLYRSPRDGRLDPFDLASRLSYFLTSSPPDSELFQHAAEGNLADPDILKSETQRLLSSKRHGNFVSSFTGQWLGTRRLSDIMPDPRLFFYYKQHRIAQTNEVEMLFEEILKENLTVETFIDPGFSYRHKVLNKIYGSELEGDQTQRVEFKRGGREGGILSLSAVMMATANGVDTHPVQRGVWLLENVFGTPTPGPPDNVPAISVDTSGTNTMRTLVEKHRADQSCARCHDQIDPLGMVLENFDPVGRWRKNYPIYIQATGDALKEEFYSSTGTGTKAGPVIDSVGVLSDGTKLNDVTDLKRYLVDNVEIFSRCLTGKLLVYATGRPMNFGDRRVIDKIVSDVKEEGNGFRDLIIAIVQSESFAVK